ncbi:ABC transporter permease [Microbacterium terricola]|uniref:Ribose ABC transporter permease n=1 Tax=Microbacterium terricola TaxID=344163 RepID=A0ABM8E0U6_9MICO|nr:ABC transporter permease [Microbacterium terricola]UYK40803.1 ABC transporter permease [Microbacterium terricola]BDV31449.1 ribose ABC transporter permease [Microbacterium terricola]
MSPTTTTIPAPMPRVGPIRSGTRRMRYDGALAPVLAFVVFFGVYLAVNPGLLTRFQLQSAANLIAPLALIALGQLLIVLIGGIDISIGAITSLCNVVFATQIAGLSAPGALLACIAVGVLCGAINGVLVAYVNLPAIAVTLATAFIYAALARQILDRPGGALSSEIYQVTSGELVPFVPIALVWVALIATGLWLFLQRTAFGRQVYGVGSGRAAVQSAGLKPRLTILVTFMVSGGIVSLGAVLLAGSTLTGDPRSGDPYLLNSIAVVALSGAAFAGGRGSILGTVLAAAVLGMVGNLLFFAGINSYWQYVISALIILAVVVIPRVGQFVIQQSALRRGHHE